MHEHISPLPADIDPTHVGIIVVHGVGEAMPGEISDALISRLERDERAGAFKFHTHSEVYPTVDPDSSKGQRFQAFLRRTHASGLRSLSITELYWADLSRIGKGPLSYAFAVLMLFFEAPLVLVESMQKGNRSIAHRLVRRLLRLATWLMRWPIAGLTIALFYSGFVFIALGHFGVPQDWSARNVPHILTAALPFLIAGGVFTAWSNVHKNIGLTDLGLSTAISGSAFLAFVLLRPLVLESQWLLGLEIVQGTAWLKDILTPDNVRMSPLTYFLYIFPALGVAWALWWLSVLMAIALLLLLEIWRLVSPWRRPARRRLVRAWSAVGIVIAQEIMWRIIIDPLTILTLVSLDRCIGTQEPGCSGATPVELYAPLTAVLRYESENFIHCLIGFGLIAVCVAAIYGLRLVMARLRRPEAGSWRMWMPRLIASPALIAALVVALFLQLVEARGFRRALGLDEEPLLGIARLLRLIGGEANVVDPAQMLLTPAGLTLMFVFLLVVRLIGKSMQGAIHIARELIDHQYTPNFGLAEMLLPRGKVGERYAGFPRRRRILRRLEQLVADVIARERYDRLILLGHSQGTVIIHDYLRSQEGRNALERLPEVHVMTLGSPLSHLYQHYFYDYGRADRTAPLPRVVVSWSNMWRCDDPIGHGVALGATCAMQNVELQPGGHTDYWREEDVIGLLIEVICGNYSDLGNGDAPEEPAPETDPATSQVSMSQA